MTTIERELARVLNQHSEPVPLGVELPMVRRGIARRRNRRRMAAVVAVALVVAVPIGLRDVLTAADRTEIPPIDEPRPPEWATPEVPVSVPMPAYHQRGAGRLIEQHAFAYDRVTPGSEQTIELAYTPDRDDVTVVVDCGGADDHVVFDLRINDHEVTNGAGCANQRVFGFGEGVSWGEDPGPLHIRTDYRIAVTLSYSAENSRNAALYPPAVAALQGQGPGELSVGLYQDVPFEAYVFPPRPAELLPFMRDDIDGPVVHRFSASELGDNGTFRQTVTAPVDPDRSLQVFSSLVGPGELRVLVNGQEVDRNTSYGWGHTFYGSGTGADPGERVEVTVIAEGFLAPAWEVTVYDAPWGGCGTDGCGGK